MEEGAGKRCSECDQYRNLSEGADRVGEQLRGDKECPFSGVTNLAEFGGRHRKAKLWRKVPESDAPSVHWKHAVSALRKVWVLIRLWKQPSTQART